MFPSPCGDYGSYLNMIYLNNDGTDYSFRPLAGIMVLIVINANDDELVDKISFRPLAGIMVLIKDKGGMII